MKIVTLTAENVKRLRRFPLRRRLHRIATYRNPDGANQVGYGVREDGSVASFSGLNHLLYQVGPAVPGPKADQAGR